MKIIINVLLIKYELVVGKKAVNPMKLRMHV